MLDHLVDAQRLALLPLRQDIDGAMLFVDEGTARALASAAGMTELLAYGLHNVSPLGAPTWERLPGTGPKTTRAVVMCTRELSEVLDSIRCSLQAFNPCQ